MLPVVDALLFLLYTEGKTNAATFFLLRSITISSVKKMKQRRNDLQGVKFSDQIAIFT